MTLHGQSPPWQARLPFFYGYVIVAVIFLQTFAGNAPLWSTGVLSVPMQDDLGWSRSTIFASITARMLGGAIGALLIGRWLDVSGRAGILVGVSGSAASLALVLVAFVEQPWQFFVVFGLVGGLLGTGPSALLIGTLVPKWFVRRRARAVATSTMGTGLGAFVLPLIINVVADSFGWRSVWIALGGMTALLTILPALLLKTRPEDIGLNPDGDGKSTDLASGRPSPADTSLTAGQAIRTSTFWLLILAVAFAFLSLPAYPVHLVQIYVDQGFSSSMAAAAFSAYGLTSFMSRFLWGYVADKLHIRMSLLLVSVYTGTMLPLLLVFPGNSALVAGAVTGLGIGGWVGLNEVVWAAYFGRAHLGAIGGITRPLITLTQAVSPLYVAGLADFSCGYTLSVLAMTSAWWLCACCFFLVRPRPPRLAADTVRAR